MAKVATFYSYKGGVGRTFLLANVAVLLSRWGRRVLCVDWDLEAPGLLHYFGSAMGRRVVSRLRAGSPVGTALRTYGPVEAPQVEGGVVDVVASVATTESIDWRDMVVTVQGDDDWSLDILPAGAPGEAYVQKLHRLNWNRLYQEHDLGWFLERLRGEWLAEYDAILIDSRTGLTDIGGICVAQLPDILVVLSSANEQSLCGCLDVIDRAARARDRLPVARPGPLVLPLASRVDDREEYDEAVRWLDRFADAWASSYRVWAAHGTEPRKLLNLFRIPYVSKWSFGERLPARHERTDDPGLISWSVANVAATLARGLGRVDELLHSRDSYVEDVARDRAPSTASRWYDVIISYANADRALADALRRALTSRGVTVSSELEAIELGDDLIEVQSEAIASSRVVVPLVTSAYIASQWAQADLRSAMMLEGPQSRRKRIVPVFVGQQVLLEAPVDLQRFQGIVTDGAMGPVADEIVGVVRRLGAS